MSSLYSPCHILKAFIKPSVFKPLFTAGQQWWQASPDITHRSSYTVWSRPTFVAL